MIKTVLIFIALYLTLIISTFYCQPNYKKQDRCREEAIPHYTAYKITDTLAIDGKLDEIIWENASRSNRFTDLISGAATWLDTRAAVLWDDQNLYVGYWIEEPDVAAKHTQRDAPIYEDNDVELFIAGQDGYYEQDRMVIMNLRSIHLAPFTKCCSSGWMCTRKKGIIK